MQGENNVTPEIKAQIEDLVSNMDTKDDIDLSDDEFNE